MYAHPNPDPEFTLKGSMDSIHSLYFHKSGSCDHLYASTQAGIVHKWNIQTCREETQYNVGTEPCLLVTRLQNNFISQSKGGVIKIWEDSNKSWDLNSAINTDYCGFCKLDVLRDKYLICPVAGSQVKAFNHDGQLFKTLCKNINDKCGEIMAIKCFTISEADYIFVLYECGLLTLFLIDGEKVSDLKVSPECPMALDFDGTSKVLVGGSGDVIVGLELTTDMKLVRWKEVKITNPGISCLVIRPDKKLFVAGCWDCTIRLFSMKSFKLLAVLQNHSQTIQDVRYSLTKIEDLSCQSLLAAAGQDGRITLWNIY